jgi:hypothetical protein
LRHAAQLGRAGAELQSNLRGGGHFRVSLTFGEKAVRAVQQSNLPGSVLTPINDAPKYPEGRGVRMEVRRAEDARIVVKLAGIKMAV